jgi:hypothetical protein
MKRIENGLLLAAQGWGCLTCQLLTVFKSGNYFVCDTDALKTIFSPSPIAWGLRVKWPSRG